MVPNTIHSKAVGPYKAPMIGPNTGPTPAIFKSWINHSFHLGMVTKSTPSLFETAGVFLSGFGTKIFSTILP